MCNVRKQIWQVVRIGNSRICPINNRVSCEYAMPVGTGQPVRLPLHWHQKRKREPIHPVARRLITQYLIGIEKKIPKEVVVGILDRFKNPTQEPIRGQCSFDCSSESGLICRCLKRCDVPPAL